MRLFDFASECFEIFHRLQWGTVPTAIGSILTGVSLAIAVSVYLHDRKVRQAGQASRVAAWLQGWDAKLENNENVDLIAKNTSDVPVYQVIIRCKGILMKSEHYGVFPPGERRLASKKYMGLLLEVLGGAKVERDVQPTISFRDSQGLCWERASNGKLRRRTNQEHLNEWNVQFDHPTEM